MMPTYGSDLRHLLFSQNTESGSNIELEDAVRNAVAVWMSKVQIDDVFISRDFVNSPYTASISISFSLKTIPDSQQELELTIEA